jgi:hypothetical protein
MQRHVLFTLIPALTLLLVPTAGHATPHAGSKELRIGQELQPPLNLSNGYIRLAPENGRDTSGLGLGGGLGFFVSDTVELGLSLNVQMLKTGANAVTGPGAAPFVRLMLIQGKVGFFVELDGSIQRLGADNSNEAETLFSIGGDMGVEFFVTDDWAVRLAPTIRHVVVSLSDGVNGQTDDASGNRYGITWGLACYF